MYVGKSLKYNLFQIYEAIENTGNDVTAEMDVAPIFDYFYRKLIGEPYVPAEPTLDNATISTDKEGLVWWGINYDKAILHTSGTIEIDDRHGTYGLTLVGTDYRDYLREETGDDYLDRDYDGGAIYGDATFVGDPVHLGWHTLEYTQYLDDRNQLYYDVEDLYGHQKGPAVPEDVDYQVQMKEADRLTIHGPTFNSDVYVFTPSNNYVDAPQTV